MTEDAVGPTEGAAEAAPSEHEGSGLDLIELSKEFAGGVVAVDDVNLHVDHGEYVVLLGPSGCGKTTTLRMIGGHEFPSRTMSPLTGGPRRRCSSTAPPSRIAASSTTSSSASRCTGCRRTSVVRKPSTRFAWSVLKSSRTASRAPFRED